MGNFNIKLNSILNESPFALDSFEELVWEAFHAAGDLAHDCDNFEDLVYHLNVVADRLKGIDLKWVPRNTEVQMVMAILAAVIHLAEIVFQEDSDTNGVFIANEHSLEHGATLIFCALLFSTFLLCLFCTFYSVHFYSC